MRCPAPPPLLTPTPACATLVVVRSDVFEMHGLVGPRTTFGHSIYLSDSEFERMHKQGSGISFCPASNLFLGSGLFKLATAKGTKTPVRVGLGTDMAGGDYFSQLKVSPQHTASAQHCLLRL